MLVRYMMDLSIIIITWNSENEINACVESVINNTKTLNAELIIIDNNSSDNTFQVINKINYSNLQTYKNEHNLGYTKAVNQGIGFSRGKNILLLNPDTILKQDTLDTLNRFLNEKNEYAAAVPLILRSEEHTSELQSHRDLHSFPTRRSSDLLLLNPDTILKQDTLDTLNRFLNEKNEYAAAVPLIL